MIDLRTIKEKRKVRIVLDDIDVNDLKTLESSCGCSDPKIENGKLVVYYTPDSLPYHLEHIGYYISEKNVKVTYKNNNYKVYVFKAKIIK